MTGSQLLTCTFSDSDPLVDGHRRHGRGLLPAAVQIELALVAAGVAGPGTDLLDVTFRRPVVVPDGGAATVRLVRPEAGTETVELVVDGASGPVGSARTAPASGAPGPVPPPVTGRAWETGPLYAAWAEAGLVYGPGFRTLAALTVGEGVAEATLHTTDGRAWIGHPLLLDGVLQLVAVLLQDPAAPDAVAPLLPLGVERVRLHAPLREQEVTVRARRVTGAAEGVGCGDAVVLDAAGRVLAELTGIRMRAAGPAGRPAPMRRLRWAPAPAPAAVTTPPGTWAVLHDGDPAGPGAAAAAALRAGGSRVVEAEPTGTEDDLTRLWAETAGSGRIDGIVLATATGEPGDEDDELERGLYAALRVVRTLAADRRTGLRLVALTERAVAATGDDRPVPARAAVWGLLRTCAIEYPRLSPRLVDVDGAAAVTAADLGDGPAECALRGGTRLLPEWEPMPAPVATGMPVRADGAYLLLGGHGGLGLAVAERFARDGAGEIHLVSRSGGAGLDPAALDAITRHGARVRSHAVDAGVPGALAELVSGLGGRPLRGVVHAAGVLRDGLLRGVTREDIAAVLAPKADGLRELQAAVAGAELDFAVLFGSVSGTFGNLGQGGYAAANAYLDAAAHRLGAPWTCVDWGLWGEIGMGVEVAERLRRRGVRPLGTEEGLDALAAVLRSPERQVVVAHPDAERAAPPASGPAATPPGSQGGPSGPAATPPVPVAGPPVGLPPGAASRTPDGTDALTAAVTAALVERLGVDRIDPGTPFVEFGMDSITSVELAEGLGRRWGTTLPPTLFLEHPDVAGVVAALRDRYGVEPHPSPGDPAPSPPAASPPGRPGGDAGPRVPVDPATDLPEGAIAVVAVSGDLPGAEDLDGFWSLLRRGATAFTPVPPERFAVDELLEDRSTGTTGTYCGTGAFVDGIDRLDPRFFELAVREVAEMDPQQKLLLEHAWSVIQEGGAAGRRDIGVFVGATYTHHRDATGLDRVGPHTALGTMNAVLANRISYALDLTGPSQTVDTLCSSSLVALEQAVTALRAGRCSSAIVAACHVGLTSWYYRSLSRLGALSATRPRPFDSRADGFVPGEGAVAVLLRPLADAVRDGDHVWGVVRGVATNHGGRGSALPVPRSSAQAAVIRAALDDAGLPPSSVQVVETHGTATPLGDPIEIAALAEVFGGDDRPAPVLLGAAKANIGHLEPASGLASLVKVLLCLRHREIPPVAGFAEPGEHVSLPDGVLEIPTAVVPWTGDAPRRAGISAFGMGGTNAHAVVEEYRPARAGARAAPDGAAGVLLLSAHTPEALRRRVTDVLAVVGPGTDPGPLYTSAGTGRRHLAHRVAVVARGAAELADGLRRAADGGPGTVVHPGDDDLAPLVAGARQWVDGGAPGPLGPAAAPYRVPLPPYPFRDPRLAADRPSPPDPEEVRLLIGGHEVFGDPTVPAALLIATGLARADVLTDVAFPARGTSVTVPEHDLDRVPAGEPGTVSQDGRVIGRMTPGGGPSAVHACGTEPCPRELDPAGLYAWFDTHGTRYSPLLRRIARIRYGDGVVTADLSPGTGPAFTDRVTALDAALQAMAVLTLTAPALSDTTLLPVAVGRVAAAGDPAGATAVRLRSRGWADDGTHVADAWLLGPEGPLVVLEGVRFRPLAASAPAAATGGPSDAGAQGGGLTQAGVLAVVRRVLDDPSVTATSSLSAAGLDSMLAGEIAAALTAACGTRVSAVEVLEARDCRALAAALGAGPDRVPEPADPATVNTAGPTGTPRRADTGEATTAGAPRPSGTTAPDPARSAAPGEP
ncbi:MAG TPA: beta-ketoacyl synthase N-terminal-like domain-containing protein, partial [Pseudonocardia sp.]|nr:beta-ketoacyl synthase N-terminal-like domain-containing protein [Pseudonocardia sp.]